MAAPWMCPSCAATIATPYCPTCGEEAVHPRELTSRGLFRQLLSAVTSIDGRFLRSVRCLIERPGALTAAYVNGQRKAFLGPFQIFLLANVLFVAVQGLTGMNVFSSPLDSHLHHQDWSPIAQRLVADRLDTTHTTLERLTPSFNRVVAWNAKSLIILMAIPFSLMLPVIFFDEHRPFGVHVVFAVHVYAFLLLLACVALAIAGVDVLCGGAGLEAAWMDNVLSTFNVVVCAIYLYLAIGRVYLARGARRVAASLVLAGGVAAIALAYRCGLFLLTLYVV